MSFEPCRELREAYIKAMRAYMEASDATKPFAAKELDPMEDLEPHPEGHFERMKAAFKRRREAEKEYLKAFKEYSDCIKSFR
jgi:hypothetical protein